MRRCLQQQAHRRIVAQDVNEPPASQAASAKDVSWPHVGSRCDEEVE
jgi:hypothetical protein